ncbi:MAG: BatD family protein [Puniceicoccales bacterium]|jgi:hypothetical protein|nr:BatD family protein [Puniceicoccales bacterium]
MKNRTIFILLFAFTAFTTQISAQTARWNPPSGSLAQGKSSRLTLIFDNCKPEESPVSPPAVNGLSFGQPSVKQTQHFSFGTGNDSSYQGVSFAYPVHTTAAVGSTVTIPAFTVRTDKGNIAVPSASYHISKTTFTDSGNTVALENVANSALLISTPTVWAGEVFPIIYSLTLAKNFDPTLSGKPKWEDPPLLSESFSEKPDMREEIRNGVEFYVCDYTTRAMALNAGTLTLPPVSQSITLLSRQRDFFGQRRSRYNIVSTPSSITVKPLPQPAPPDFSGAIGSFKLKAKVAPKKIAVGDPLTWTLELSGTGNWHSINALPPREISRDFRIVQPQAKKNQVDGSPFKATFTEDIIAIPSKAGIYTLGSVKINVFDPKTGEYTTLRTPAVTVEVTPSTAAPTQTPSPATNSPTNTPPAHPLLPAPPDPPTPLPKDPLPPAPPTKQPFSNGELPPLILASLFWAFPIWLLLSARHAARTDSARPHRNAHSRLNKTLLAIASATKTPTESPAQLHPLLLAWQHDTAILWNISNAAPTPNEIPDARWTTLWRDADRTLYLPNSDLPPSWLKDARLAWKTTRPPRYNPLRAFFPKNLFPFLSALALSAALLTTNTAHAAQNNATDAAAAYAAANFDIAGQRWRENISRNPTDWSSRHNLALALAQQERWHESAAHATAAFLNNPRSNAIRWHLRLALSKTGNIPAPLVPLLDNNFLAASTTLLSPTLWQRLLIAGTTLTALTFTLALARLYRNPRPSKRQLAPFLLPLAIAALAITFASKALKTYGILADTRTAIIWKESPLYSIPTEADSLQQTAPAPVGSAVIIEKNFLGWHRISFENGQTAWLRSENLIPLWK